MNQLGLLIKLKATSFKNRFLRLKSNSRLELVTLSMVLALAAGAIFCFFFYSLTFFRRQEPFGPILIDETFYLLNFALFLMLVISSAISSYSSLFRSREIPFLLTKPVQWPEIYFMKLSEALWYSSCSLIFVIIPFMTAYGLSKQIHSLLFPLICAAFYIPFILIAGMMGTLIAVFTVWLLPSRTSRKIALMILVMGLGLFMAKIQPRIIEEQGSLGGILTGYLPHVAFAKAPGLPSYWLSKGILLFQSSPGDRCFYFLVILSNALFFLIPSYSVGAKLYPSTFLKAEDHGEAARPRRIKVSRAFEKLIDSLPWPSKPSMAFLEKDIKIFLRDPAEWSQLIIFFGLLLLYFMNLRNLQFHILKDFWKHFVFILNTIGTYVVLSSFSMRFVFPMLSMEGSKSWIVGMAPIRFSSLLLEKFLLGMGVSLFLSLPLVLLSGWMLEIPLKPMVFTLGMGFFVCVALTGLSVGLGARFIDFKASSPSQVIAGFGGSILLLCHLAYLALIGTLLIVSKNPRWLVFWTAAAGSLLVGVLPLKLGEKKFRTLEF